MRRRSRTARSPWWSRRRRTSPARPTRPSTPTTPASRPATSSTSPCCATCSPSASGCSSPAGASRSTWPTSGRKPYRSLSADVIRILQDDLGLLLRGEVVWRRPGAPAATAPGAPTAAPANPVLRDVTERVVVASKGRFDRALSRRTRRAAGPAPHLHPHRRRVHRRHPRRVGDPARVAPAGRPPGPVPRRAAPAAHPALHLRRRPRPRPLPRVGVHRGRGGAHRPPLRRLRPRPGLRRHRPRAGSRPSSRRPPPASPTPPPWPWHEAAGAGHGHEAPVGRGAAARSGSPPSRNERAASRAWAGRAARRPTTRPAAAWLFDARRRLHHRAVGPGPHRGGHGAPVGPRHGGRRAPPVSRVPVLLVAGRPRGPVERRPGAAGRRARRRSSTSSRSSPRDGRRRLAAYASGTRDAPLPGFWRRRPTSTPRRRTGAVARLTLPTVAAHRGHRDHHRAGHARPGRPRLGPRGPAAPSWSASTRPAGTGWPRPGRRASHDADFARAWDNGLAFLRADDALRSRVPARIEWKGPRQAARSPPTCPPTSGSTACTWCRASTCPRCSTTPAPAGLFDVRPAAARWARRATGSRRSPRPSSRTSTARSAPSRAGRPARRRGPGPPARAGRRPGPLAGATCSRRPSGRTLPTPVADAYASLAQVVASARPTAGAPSLGDRTESERLLWRLLRIGGAPVLRARRLVGQGAAHAPAHRHRLGLAAGLPAHRLRGLARAGRPGGGPAGRPAWPSGPPGRTAP